MPTYLRIRQSDRMPLHLHPTVRNSAGRWHNAWERHAGDNAHHIHDAANPIFVTSGRYASHYEIERALRLGQISPERWDAYRRALGGEVLLERRPRPLRRNGWEAPSFDHYGAVRVSESEARVSDLIPPMEFTENDPWLRPISGRKFGVEIECITDQTEVSRLFREAGIALNEAGNRVARSASSWTFKGDGSLHYDGSKPGFHTAELVSPPLRGEAGLKQLKQVCSILNQVGTLVNKSCGLHVHHDAADFQVTTTRMLALTYAHSQVQIDKFLAASRRSTAGATYCKPFYPVEVQNIMTATSLREFPNDRYRNLNISPAFSAHGTYEFRQHQGTTDFQKIAAWIKLGQAMMKHAISYSRHIQPTSVMEMMTLLDMPEEAKEFFIQRSDAMSKAPSTEAEVQPTSPLADDLFEVGADGLRTPRVGWRPSRSMQNIGHAIMSGGRQQGRTVRQAEELARLVRNGSIPSSTFRNLTEGQFIPIEISPEERELISQSARRLNRFQRARTELDALRAGIEAEDRVRAELRQIHYEQTHLLPLDNDGAQI